LRSSNDETEVHLRRLSEKNARYEEHFRSGDFQAMVASFYAPRFHMVFPDRQAVTDHAELAGLFAEYLKTIREVKLDPKVTRFNESCDMAWQLANSMLVPRDGSAPVECRYVVVWRRINGDWFCELDFFAYGFLQ